MVNSPEQMSAHAEQILHDSMYGSEALQMIYRLELSHLAFALTGRLKRHFRSVVLVLPGAVNYRWRHAPARGRVV